jgi:predicted site-specific integrase-resolvase
LDGAIPEQKRDLETYVAAKYPGETYKHFVRTASGLNFDAVMPLVDAVIRGEVSKVIACNYDRLLRLGNKLLIQVFALYNTDVVFINDNESTDSLEPALGPNVQ